MCIYVYIYIIHTRIGINKVHKFQKHNTKKKGLDVLEAPGSLADDDLHFLEGM